MSEQIHDKEADTSQEIVHSLLAAQCPGWSGFPISHLPMSGTDNAMWRVHAPGDHDFVARLPRTDSAANTLSKELDLLPELAKASLPVETPTIVHAGTPSGLFPHRWAVYVWIEGDDAWSAHRELEPNTDEFARDLAQVVKAIGKLEAMPAPDRPTGDRGGPLLPLLDRLDRWLLDPEFSALDLIDVPAIRRSAAESAEAAVNDLELAFTHGDLIPGNLLVRRQRLAAVIDWGGAAYADPAQDLAPAWAVLDQQSRRTFREAVEADDAYWLRARAFELEHAVGGILYYRPKNHPLADVMGRTLDRILNDS